ncbi:MAG: type II toxin-antitoxin system HicA family toxin [Chloroflexi bacterium]|nr:type II toxin-antitoxin system HicA family toxin [Chloroflexota bacterium]
MPKVPRLTGQQVITALKRTGFEVLRVKGSHHFLGHSDGRHTVVPVHRGETIIEKLPGVNLCCGRYY